MEQSYSDLLYFVRERWGIFFNDTLENRRDMLILSGWHCSKVYPLKDCIAWRIQAWKDADMQGEADVDTLLGLEEEVKEVEEAIGSERIRFAAIGRWPGGMAANYSPWCSLREEKILAEIWEDFFPIAFNITSNQALSQ